MTWNLRVVEFDDPHVGSCLMVVAVHYDQDGKPYRHSPEGAVASGSDYTEIQMDIDKMAKALTLPRLRAADFVTD